MDGTSRSLLHQSAGHAKAWCFHRATGFSTVYVGSSNLTFSAQVTGREWNARASERRNPDLIETFDRVFETYWADPHFEPFDATQFADATAREVDDSITTPFTIEPYPFQRQILGQLEVERCRGRNHNLVVAATGKARPWSPPSTTGSSEAGLTGPGCCSSRTARNATNSLAARGLD